MNELGAKLRHAGVVATLAVAAGSAGQAGAEFKSALTPAQLDRIFAQECQSEESTMRRDAAAAGESYIRDDRINLSVVTGELSRDLLEEAMLEGRRDIENTTNPLNRTLYLLMHCLIEAKYNIALEREKLTSPTPTPAPAPTPSGSTAFRTPFNPQPASGTTSSIPQNGPLVSEDEDEDEEEAPAPTPPAAVAPKPSAPASNTAFQGNGPLVSNTPPPPRVDVQGEPIDERGARCFNHPPPTEEQISTGMRYTFVFVNRCDAPIIVNLTYSANPLAKDPTTYVSLYPSTPQNPQPLTWSCDDQNLGAGDCTKGVVGMFARWR